MKNGNLVTILIGIVVAVIIFYVVLYLYNEKMYNDIKSTFGMPKDKKDDKSVMKEGFYHFNPLSSPDGKYSEPSLTCQLARNSGLNQCTLTTGRTGRCSPETAECVEIPYIDLPVRDHYHLPPPIGEISPDCAFRTICTRSDNTFGVCMSGWCYPNSSSIE